MPTISTKRSGIPTFDKAELDEPIFVLRAQDILAPVIVQLYALHCTTKGVAKAKIAEMRRIALAMREWQAIHPDKVKVPD